MKIRNLLIGMAIAGAMLLSLETGLRLVWRYAGTEASSVTSLENHNDPSATRIVLPSRVVEELGTSQRFGVQSNILTFPDPHLIFRVRPNPTNAPVYCYEGIDGQGFRTGGLEHLGERARNGGIRILLLGDSCAFGWNICRFDQTIGSQLQSFLAKDGRSVEVINLAQPGYSTAQGLLLFRHWFPVLRPDFVVTYFGWNDLFPTRGLTDSQILRLLPIAASPWAQALMRTALFKTFAWAASRLLPNPRESSNAAPTTARFRVPLEESVANVRAMIEESKAGGASVLIVVAAYGQQFSHHELRIDAYNQAIREAVGTDAALVPLPAMHVESPDAAGYFVRDGYHPNARGTHYIAETIAAVIRGEHMWKDRELEDLQPASAVRKTLQGKPSG